jgi:hypothetical protein
MRWLGKRCCRTHDSVLFLGCPIDLELVDESRLKNHPSSSETSDTNNGDDNYPDEDEDEQRMFNIVDKYIAKNYGSLFYLGQAVVGTNPDWSDQIEVYLAIHLPEDLNITNLTRFFANLDQSVLDQFRTLMKLLGQPEEESEPELCSG